MLQSSKRFWLLAIPLLTACDDLIFGGCDVTRDFLEEARLGSASVVRIEAEAGSLEVIGRPDLSRVRVTGQACAGDDGTLDDIDLVVQRTAEVIRAAGMVPSGGQLDLVIEVPEKMVVDIEDTSGDIEVSNVRAAFILDRGGDIVVENVDEDVEVVDESGDLQVIDVGSDVRILDGGGVIEVEDVGQTVQVEDGGGDIVIRDVGEDVIVEDGGGDIDVDTVGGDFIVNADSSGRIRSRNVSGRTELPD